MLQAIAVGKYLVLRLPDGSALVSSKSAAGGFHTVKAGACDCLGYSFKGRCSHTEAAQAAHE